MSEEWTCAFLVPSFNPKLAARELGLPMASSCVQCGAGADALLEDDGQLVCMDCGTVVGGLLSNEVAFGEHTAANMPSYHSQQRLDGGTFDWRRVEARIRTMCEQLHMDAESTATAQQLTKVVLGQPRSGVPLEATGMPHRARTPD